MTARWPWLPLVCLLGLAGCGRAAPDPKVVAAAKQMFVAQCQHAGFPQEDCRWMFAISLIGMGMTDQDWAAMHKAVTHG